MGRKQHKMDVRVEVYPRSMMHGTIKEDVRNCEEMVEQINRYVDGVGSASVVYDTYHECEHCASDWSENANSPHNGGCCERDSAVYYRESKESCEYCGADCDESFVYTERGFWLCPACVKDPGRNMEGVGDEPK